MKDMDSEEPDDIHRRTEGSEAEQRLDVDLEQENAYALVVKGRSMIEDHICDGDYVVVKPQRTCENGDIVVAVHLSKEDHRQVTLKRFFQEHDKVRLQPANSEMDAIFVSKDEWEREWQIQGKVVAIFRQVRSSDSA